MLTQQWEGEIFADYNQFYLWDGGISVQAPVDYTDEDVIRRIKAGNNVVVIQPERNFTVPVVIEIHNSAPKIDLAPWDHIAEASLHLPTGSLQIEQCTGGIVTDFNISPGWYRVRSLHANLGSVDGLEGEDHYLVLVWPAPESPLAILKQFNRGPLAR